MSADGKKSLKERKAEGDSPLVQPGTVIHGAVEQITPASRVERAFARAALA